MKNQIHEEPRIVASAERRMQGWVRQEESHGIGAPAATPFGKAVAIGPYVSLSREAGAGGSEIAQMVGERLGWEVLDKNLMDNMADRFHLSKEMLSLIDETPGNWVFDVLGTWMDPALIPHEKYVMRLGRVVLAAARRGKVVLVGRGAQFLLPPDRGLSVRIIAPLAYRVHHIMEQMGETAAGARTWVENMDRQRHEFVRRYFRRDVADSHLYDLVLNVERIGPEGVVEAMIGALRQKGFGG
jgi:cytidylate kinase